MIAGIGIDAVEITRFNDWKNLPLEKLTKVLSEEEITYCTQNNNAPERFAARFAAREAFYKALSQTLPGHTIPFFTICKNSKVINEHNGNPQLIVNWKQIIETYSKPISSTFTTFISLTHTNTEATAMVIIEKNS